MTGPASSLTLLAIIPDSETLALTLEQANSRGLSVVTAQDPQAALMMADMALPDIVITDLFLPEHTGLTLVQEIHNRFPNTAIIVSAGTADGQTVIEAMRAGGTDYLPQPTCTNALAMALDRAIQHVPHALEEIPGIEELDYRLTIGTDPHQVEPCVTWLIEQTARRFPEAQRLHLRATLIELIVNAVEHGSLEIQYQEKHEALSADTFDALIEARRRDPRFAERHVVVQACYDMSRRRLRYAITDEGKGFMWKRFLAQNDKACDNHDANGRGLFLAKAFFPNLIYNERGNEVTFSVPLP